jgi:16S rRNA (guanine(966)-N(2))-methyltransferase RsmD
MAPGRAESRSRAGTAGTVRIIGGQWKRTPIAVENATGLRPTPSRVRETLFNWLGQDLTGRRCVDLFAGTGALSFEAASRGAALVICIERQAAAFGRLTALVQRLSAAAVKPVRGDALEVAARLARDEPHAFDLVFVDPPFEAGLHARAMAIGLELLRPQGLMYVESSQPVQAPPRATIVRAARAGQVHYHLLRTDA